MSKEKDVELTREGFLDHLITSYADSLEKEMENSLTRISELSTELKKDIWDYRVEEKLLLNVKIYKEARIKLETLCHDDEVIKDMFPAKDVE